MATDRLCLTCNRYFSRGEICCTINVPLSEVVMTISAAFFDKQFSLQLDEVYFKEIVIYVNSSTCRVKK